MKQDLLTPAASKPSVSVQINATSVGFNGYLRIAVEHGPVLERALADSHCDALVEALALVAAMDLTPTVIAQAVKGPTEPSVVAPDRPPFSSQPAPAMKQEATKAPQVSTAAFVGLVTAPTPKTLVTGGISLALGWASRPESLGLSIQYGQTGVLGFAAGEVRFRWLAARLLGCPLGLRRAFFTVSGCATADMGVLRAEPDNTLAGRARNGWWVAPGAGSLIGMRLDDVVLELFGGGVFPLVRDEFFFAGARPDAPKERVHRPPAIGLASELRLGVSF